MSPWAESQLDIGPEEGSPEWHEEEALFAEEHPDMVDEE